MKLLPRLVPGVFNQRFISLFRSPRSICQRSIHALPAHGPPREPSDVSPAAAAAAKDPSWVLLGCEDCRSINTLVAGAKTTAECSTSTGKPVRVSFDLAAPPASSILYYGCSEAAQDHKYGRSVNIIAAHGDSVLLRMMRRREPSSSTANPYETFDHFVYTAGGAARPPSLSLLPPLKFLKTYQEGIRDPKCIPLLNEDTGILRRGDDEFLVARIEVLSEHSGGPALANLCVLAPGRSDWEEKRLVPILHEEGDEVMGSLTGPDMAIPFGDRFLCWIGYHSSFILCDMADKTSPKLRHVALPMLPYDPDYYTNDLPPLTDTQNMGAAGDSAVRFVAIEPRCCCGRFGRCSCARSRYPFTVTTWTLTLTMDEPMTWDKDGVLDCEELWALPGYEGIPRVHLQQPIVSLDNPDVVCFKVVSYEDRKVWMIQVDVRRKTILTAAQCTTDPWQICHSYYLRPAKLQ